MYVNSMHWYVQWLKLIINLVKHVMYLNWHDANMRSSVDDEFFLLLFILVFVHFAYIICIWKLSHKMNESTSKIVNCTLYCVLYRKISRETNKPTKYLHAPMAFIRLWWTGASILTFYINSIEIVCILFI